MKKIISLLLVFVILLSATSCNLFHTHNFVISEEESKAAKCIYSGIEVSYCSCGERQEIELEKLGHDMQFNIEVKPTCTLPGTTYYKCSRCEERSSTPIDAPGHAYDDAPSEPSRVIVCKNEGCTSTKWADDNGKHDEALTFHFTAEDEAKINAKYDEVLAMIEAAPKYDAALHGYAETGALADEYATVDEAHTELYDLIEYAISQRQLAQVAYYCDMYNTELEETYSYMMDYHTEVVAKFYTLSRPFYDSCYRDYFYHGMTEEEIKAYLFDSDAVSNPEYTALKDRNNAIEIEFLDMTNPEVGDRLPILYAEFVENNNKMAKILGYDNYLEYAYENVYERDYTYVDVANLSEYVKTYLSPAFNSIYGKWSTISGYTEDDIKTYYTYIQDPFFASLKGNSSVNDYIDLFTFTSNPDKNISFSDEFNKLMGEGNMFRGNYEGAFVNKIYSVNLPIAYFGKGYDSCFTVVHEFGHYMNEIYNSDMDDEFEQSYDLLEMHSQGNEILYLYYIENNDEMSEKAHELVRTYSLVNMLYSIMAGMTIDSFEQAVYLNKYEGTNADVIMADGKITYDEYDLLYTGICTNYGVASAIDGYWRNGMTITSPCYYVSYSVSSISVLQLYEMANTDGFDAAKDAYLKLFTYMDEDDEMTIEEIFNYAGLLSFKNEQLYMDLRKYLSK